VKIVSSYLDVLKTIIKHRQPFIYPLKHYIFYYWYKFNKCTRRSH